ncbi:acyl carrier protein [Streptomyces sp. NBC_00820]|uniref:acyl carrier protein n=1 Tax=Streptomyces sp. NBC_00820 TaxID=2975842 RepID=UPI002ED4F7E9|nr:acyl carrier protein [Streptomyces sp. NBC_00820]
MSRHHIAGDDALPDGGEVATAELVLAVVTEVTGQSPVRPADSFFDLGGTSLDAVRICLRIGRRIGTDIDATTLLDSEDLAAFVETVDAARAAR